MNISEHTWFSNEHFWTSLIQGWRLLATEKQVKTMETGVFYNIDAGKNDKWKISESLLMVFFEKF